MTDRRDDYCTCTHNQGVHDNKTGACFAVTKGKPCDCDQFKSEAQAEAERDKRLRTPWKTLPASHPMAEPELGRQTDLKLSSPNPPAQMVEKPQPPPEPPRKKGLDEWI